MKHLRSVFRMLLLIDVALAVVFGFVALLICFRPDFMYPRISTEIDFWGKSREEVWMLVKEKEMKSKKEEKILISEGYDDDAVSRSSYDFAAEYWFDKENIDGEKSEKNLDELLGRKEYAGRHLKRRWMIFRRKFVFLYALHIRSLPDSSWNLTTQES